MDRRVFLISIFIFCCLGTAKAQEPQLVLPVGHTATITDVFFSGPNIISASYDKTVKFWNPRNGMLLKEFDKTDALFDKHQYTSPDGKYMLIAFADSSCSVIDLSTAEIVRVVKKPGAKLHAALFTNDAKKFITEASVGKSRSVLVWDAETGEVVKEMSGRLLMWKESNLLSRDNSKLITYDPLVTVWDMHTGKPLFTLPIEKNFYVAGTVSFSPDASKILVSDNTDTVSVWDANTGKLITSISNNKTVINKAIFTPDGNGLMLFSGADSIKVWDLIANRLRLTMEAFYPSNDRLNRFSSDGKKLLTVSKEGQLMYWNIETGKLISATGPLLKRPAKLVVSLGATEKTVLYGLEGAHTFYESDLETGKLIRRFEGLADGLSFFSYSADKTIIASVGAQSLKLWNTQNGSLLSESKRTRAKRPTCAAFDTMGSKAAIGYGDGSVMIWDMSTGTPVLFSNRHRARIKAVSFSKDGRTILSSSTDGIAKRWDAETNEELFSFQIHEQAGKAFFSDNNKWIFAYTKDKKVGVWDSETGELTRVFPAADRVFESDIAFNAKYNALVVQGRGGKTQIWDVISGDSLFSIESGQVIFDPTGEKIASSANGAIFIWKFSERKLVGKIPYPEEKDISIHPITLLFSNDGKKIISKRFNPGVTVYDVESGKLVSTLSESGNDVFMYPMVSADDKKVLMGEMNGNVRIWDLTTGRLEKKISISGSLYASSLFRSDNEKFLLSLVEENAVSLWDMQRWMPLHKILAVDSADYLVFDDDYRYDGTAAARKELYFTCNLETIGIDQLKERLWVPDLAGRVMQGEAIAAQKLSELDICSLIPKIENNETDKAYSFLITPRKGGLGETILLVNNIETKRYDKSELKKNKDGYQLTVAKDSLQPYLIDSVQNSVDIIAYAKETDIFARGDGNKVSKTTAAAGTTNLYAVMVGVSDYKGTKLDLRYPAKDAQDLSSALYLAARKLLNTDGREHVFMYNINTGDKRSFFPEKKAIRQVFETISKKATANDILFVFFAGHGTSRVAAVGKGRPQFYFLTAEASSAEDYGYAGISMQEIAEWMKPANIKAQKRILIFDACNSGQAINDFITLGGKGQQYIAARSGMDDAQTRLLEKLKDRSGLFILSAAASTQRAYEIGDLSQGLLTYSLLKALKEQPSILDNGRFLNVDRWFAASEKIVADALARTRYRQNPQKFGAGGFNVGIVDGEVISRINIARAKPLFKGSVLLNKVSNDDDLELIAEVNRALENAAAAERSEISYVAGSASPEAYSLTGSYQLGGNVVTVSLNIKQGRNITERLTEVGDRRSLPVLAAKIVARATKWVSAKQ